jgi:hypothetical protein
VSTASWKSYFSSLRKIWSCDEAHGIAEYAIMLAAILLIVTGVLRLLGATTNEVFSTVARVFSPDRATRHDSDAPTPRDSNFCVLFEHYPL